MGKAFLLMNNIFDKENCAEISPKEETGIHSIPVALPGQHHHHSGMHPLLLPWYLSVDEGMLIQLELTHCF